MEIDELEKKVKKKVKKNAPHLTTEEKEKIHRSYLDYHKKHNEDIIYAIPMEEMAELTQHLSKLLRNKEEFNNLALLEEMADVQICLDNLKILMDTDEELLKYIEDVKMERVKKKVENGDM